MIYKAAKLELLILTEAGMSNDEIMQWILDAMKDYCDFIESTVKVVETHDSVLADVFNEAQA